MNPGQQMLLTYNLCVLSTSLDNQPNSSLMQYVTNEAATEIYMLTLKKSTKLFNIVNNPQISFLVDSRDNSKINDVDIRALTVYGKADLLDEKPLEVKAIALLTQKIPGMVSMAKHPEVGVIRVKIESMLLYEGLFNNSFYTL